jgi:hemerythrin superfamily protein
MSDADRDRAEAASLPEDDVVAVVLRQHAMIRDMMTKVSNLAGHARLQAFTELSALLKAHERAEQEILRPVGVDAEGKRSAKARTREEQAADEALLHLDGLDVDGGEFRDRFETFRMMVTEHAEAEEKNELGPILDSVVPEERVRLGQAFLDAVGARR